MKSCWTLSFIGTDHSRTAERTGASDTCHVKRARDTSRGRPEQLWSTRTSLTIRGAAQSIAER
eukprot:scaffold1768_cov60-Phaeocystis_antarctica.AAC.2